MPSPSPIIPLAVGKRAPNFTLTDALSGQPVTLSAILGRGVVINFWSVECPWTRYYDDYFIEQAAQWRERGVTLVMVNSNTNETVEQMRDMADAYGMSGPILVDEGGVVANAYGAQTTPHLFVVDSSGIVVYQGAIDDRSFRQPEPTVNYLTAAVTALLAGEAIHPAETPAYGCIIVRER